MASTNTEPARALAADERKRNITVELTGRGNNEPGIRVLRMKSRLNALRSNELL